METRSFRVVDRTSALASSSPFEAEFTKDRWDAHSIPGLRYPAIKHTKDYLQAHYAQEVALQKLADVVNMSPFHLARVFRQVVGLPPHAYQTQLRMARARTLLAQGYEVAYVASETGFFDQSHFTLQFKRRYQVTPGNYRKTARFS